MRRVITLQIFMEHPLSILPSTEMLQEPLKTLITKNSVEKQNGLDYNEMRQKDLVI